MNSSWRPRRLLWLILVIGIAACSLRSGGGFSDGVAFVVFNGVRYEGGSASGMLIDESDLRPLGMLDEIGAAVEDEAFALGSIDPRLVIITRELEPERSPYGIFFGPNVLWGGPDPPFYVRIPGLCAYMESSTTRNPPCPGETFVPPTPETETGPLR